MAIICVNITFYYVLPVDGFKGQPTTTFRKWFFLVVLLLLLIIVVMLTIRINGQDGLDFAKNGRQTVCAIFCLVAVAPGFI